jgi:hypothetical protein
MEEEMIRGLSSVLVCGTFMLSFVNAAPAGGAAVDLGPDSQDRSLLSTWDKPAFVPGRDLNEVPSPDSRAARRGPKIDLLLSPQMPSAGPLMAQTAPSRSNDPAKGLSSERPK